MAPHQSRRRKDPGALPRCGSLCQRCSIALRVRLGDSRSAKGGAVVNLESWSLGVWEPCLRDFVKSWILMGLDLFCWKGTTCLFLRACWRARRTTFASLIWFGTRTHGDVMQPACLRVASWCRRTALGDLAAPASWAPQNWPNCKGHHGPAQRKSWLRSQKAGLFRRQEFEEKSKMLWNSRKQKPVFSQFLEHFHSSNVKSLRRDLFFGGFWTCCWSSWLNGPSPTLSWLSDWWHPSGVRWDKGQNSGQVLPTWAFSRRYLFTLFPSC